MIQKKTRSGLLDRRFVVGAAFLSVPTVGLLGFAAQTGRIDLITPALPDQGDLTPVPGVRFRGAEARPIQRQAFFEGVTLVNFWASWCPYCRAEHGELMALAERRGIRLFGIVADDSEDKVAEYLKGHGNPFQRLSVDHQRLYIRAFKQRGVPATYVFRQDGLFQHKINGGLTADLVATRLLPAVEAASASA
jgi:DsbE subfamily thiol:disulfide oxidoreductase